MSEERLARIEADQARILAVLEHLTSKVDDRDEKADQWRASIDLTLHGDGNGHRGLLVRLDRLEMAQQAQEKARAKQTKLLMTVAAACASLAVKAVWTAVAGG